LKNSLEKEPKVKRLYEQARASDKPSIIFIDEIDAIAKKRLDDRRHGGEEVERTMSQLLSELDGLDSESSNVVSIFATNKPDVMDPALLTDVVRLRYLYLMMKPREKFYRFTQDRSISKKMSILNCLQNS